MDFQGEHLTAGGVTFAPVPAQRPRPPVWIGCDWPSRPPLRRASRWDGIAPMIVSPRDGSWAATPEMVAEIVAAVSEHRDGGGPFDVVIAGHTQVAEAKETVTALAAASATWWLEGFRPSRGSTRPPSGASRAGRRPEPNGTPEGPSHITSSTEGTTLASPGQDGDQARKPQSRREVVGHRADQAVESAVFPADGHQGLGQPGGTSSPTTPSHYLPREVDRPPQTNAQYLEYVPEYLDDAFTTTTTATCPRSRSSVRPRRRGSGRCSTMCSSRDSPRASQGMRPLSRDVPQMRGRQMANQFETQRCA